MSPQSDLATAIHTGRALIICGAGISMAASGRNAPSWKALIASAIEAASASPDPDSGWTSDMAEDCQSILSSAKSTQSVLEQLNRVQDALGGKDSDVYRAWLGSTVGQLTATDPAILTAIESLTVTGSKIATTNYDTLLAQHFKSAESISCLYPRMIDDLLEGRRHGVWHLHGCYDQPQSVVFSA